MAAHTGQPIERISADIERDFILRGDDAVDYGLVDAVITKRALSPVAALTPGYRSTAPDL